MKLWIAALALLATSSTFAAETPHYPKLYFSYSWLYDDVCAGNNPVDQAWAKEASERESEFAAIWESEATTLFQPVFQRWNRGFSRHEMTATLSVCFGGGSFSNPLVLMVKPYLKSFMGDQVRPNSAFADLVFHELLHTWLMENFDWEKSRLLTQDFKDVSLSMKAHMHLMALQVYTYTVLKRPEWLEWLDWSYNRFPGDYKAAWNNVKTRGFEAFIAEIDEQLPR